MGKKFYTCIIVPNASSRLHKVRVPASFLYLVSVLALVTFSIATGFGFNYAKMAFRVADYNLLMVENTTLKVETKNLEVSTRQLGSRIFALENLSAKITSIVESEIRSGRRGQALDGIGGASVNYPTAELVSKSSLKEQVELLKDRASELETQLRLVEQLAERSARRLRFTPSLWPIRGPIRSHYGQRLDPFSREGEFHLGVDISGLYGSAVRTPADGLVIYSYRKSAYGNLIIVDHGNGITTRHGHLSRFAVRTGQKLKKGDIIGYVGTSGRTTGAHLHYEVRLNDRPVNPRNYLPRLAVN